MTTRVPEPTDTPDGPAYEGRLLDRPEEEVVDQGVGFDLRTLVSRRMFLGAGVAGAGAVALAACSDPTRGTTNAATSTGSAASSTLPSGEIPDETAGPYPADGSNGPDVLSESGIVRSDIRSSIGADAPVDGVPLEFTFTVTDMANDDAPFADVAVYAWHCDAQGQYSMYSEGVEDETWLRGVQVADADGAVTFTSVMPGCYAGRWTHIHFEVYPDADSIDDSANAISTSQMAIPEDVLNEVYTSSVYDGSSDNLSQITLDTDNVFGEDAGALQMATISGDVDSGYIASLVVRVDTTTEPTAGAAPAGGGPGGAGGEGGEGGGPGGEPPNGESPGEPPAGGMAGAPDTAAS
ncbi:intradiol ring-cleavage dioxygenase [Corynebacterium glyciniphilum]|uniref:intradiol ring-cleavage dioxygenase n=1 Tax=Corynebacterium glyciniphilum TaxID=1404244 RepID=UPI002654D862|nr:intradiol ring-cleavage dioxygenase [Corynebacterium glyciniphilum]MDN5684777.1 intradiol ring-cleavage dioxygenase [Corynebacterium glyciniphilum]